MRYLNFILVVLLLQLAACATVRPKDIAAWADMPVAALDTHSFFITVPMTRRVTDDGIEVRNYRNGKSSTNCFDNTFISGNGKNANAFTSTNCYANDVVCNNIFFIKNGRVLEYLPSGNCYTNESLQPESRWRSLLKR